MSADEMNSALPNIRDFPQFSTLPSELRQAIWQWCLPHRVMELDQQPDDIIWEAGEPPCDATWKIVLANKAPPLISRVCREARAVAFRYGSPTPLTRDGFAQYMNDQAWLDPARDMVHLNWEPVCDIEWQTYDWGDPLRTLMHHVDRTAARRASVRIDLLRTFAKDPATWTRDPHYRWTKAELAELMRPRTSWTVIVLPPVVVHADAVTVAGLFGLLADARVQIVSEWAQIEEFLELGKKPDVVNVGEGCSQDEWVMAKSELKELETLIWGSNGGPTLIPAVMFRLCTLHTSNRAINRTK